LGFAGIPFLSFTAFTVITLCLLWYKQREDDEEAQSKELIHSRSENTLKSASLLLVIVYLVVVAAALLDRTGANAQSTDSPADISADAIQPVVTTVLTPPALATFSPELLAQGQQVFSRQCSACHGQNAQGVANLGLPLVGNPFINERTDAELLEFIKTGRLPSDTESQTGMTMPGKGGNPALSDGEILAVIAYLRSLDQ
jgi:mono/diheme cytochrome c family protein